MFKYQNHCTDCIITNGVLNGTFVPNNSVIAQHVSLIIHFINENFFELDNHISDVQEIEI